MAGEQRTQIRFLSKRNEVTGDGSLVTKKFASGEDYRRELHMVELLYEKNVRIPKMISHEQNVIVYEHIKGDLYADIVQKMQVVHAKAIADWLREYHKAADVLRGDVNLRNFIFSKGLCTGIDFESECAQGEAEIDFGKLIAFAATYDPVFSPEKQKSCEILLNELLTGGVDINKIKNAYIFEIKLMMQRRKGTMPTLNDAILFFESLR